MYEKGIMLALALYIYQVASIVYLKNSRLNQNLKKIGYRIGWYGKTKPASSKTGAVMLIIKVLVWLSGLIFILFSWFYVLLVGGWYIYQLLSSLTAPPEIKRLRWKMRNLDMSFDEILREQMIAQNMDLAYFDEYKQNYIAEMQYINDNHY